MTDRAFLVLSSDAVRAKAITWIKGMPDGTRVAFNAPTRTVDQNALLWPLLTEVSRQAKHHGATLTEEDWKVLFMDALNREMRLVLNLEGTGMVALGRSSSKLSKAEFSDLIELILAYGASHNITFREATRAA